nr:MAG TPA: hypothetical protein [Caudoviricetes sp.]
MRQHRRKYKPSKKAISNFIAFIADKPPKNKSIKSKGVTENGK